LRYVKKKGKNTDISIFFHDCILLAELAHWSSCPSKITLISAWKSLLWHLNIHKRKRDIDNTTKYWYSDISKISILNHRYYYTFSMYSRSWLVREHRVILNIRYLLRNFSCWRAQRPMIVFLDRTCIQKKILLDAVVPKSRPSQQLKPKNRAKIK
jgi:hypothetical protein